MKKFTFVIFGLALVLLAGYQASAQRITVTLGGGPVVGYGGDAMSGRMAKLWAPHDICMDAAENIYFTDSANGRVRRISAADGRMTTVAGGGTSLADGIPAKQALMVPRNMCIDAAGNLFVVSYNKVRRIDAVTHIITTVAGTGTYSFTGDGGPAIAASFQTVYGICVDNANNLYIVDQNSNRIRKVTASTGFINTIAGTGTAGLTGDGGLALAAELAAPETICVSPTGDIYFGDQGANAYATRIRKIDAATGIISAVSGTVTGGGYVFGVPSLETWLGEVTGLCMNSHGDLFCNEISCSCRRIDMTLDTVFNEGGDFSVESYADNIKSNIAYMNNPYGLCADAANHLYVADKYNNRIRKLIALSNTPSFAYGKGVYVYPCAGTPLNIDSSLVITDLDMSQTETWTIVTPPSHGSVSGFPATATSNGINSIVAPAGLNYSVASGFSGVDSFVVKVSDGTLSSTIKVYVAAGAGLTTGPNAICAAASITMEPGIEGGTWSVTTGNASITTDGVVTGLAAGTDTVLYTVTNFCGSFVDRKLITVDMAVPATAGTISGPAMVCAGAAITMGNTLSGGVWTISNANASISGTGMVNGTTGGRDTVIYTVSNTCGSTQTTAVIDINTLPDAGTIAGAATVCKGGIITYSNSVAGGVWATTNSKAAISGVGYLTGLAVGTDTIQYAVTNMCGTTTSTKEIVVTNCNPAGVPVVQVSSAHIFPNPVSEVLTIEWSALEAGAGSISLADVTGRVVVKDVLINTANGTGRKEINVKSLSEGVYLLNVNAGTFHYTDKVFVQK